ncbi:MAG: hypothetical protein HWE10_05735 [Gammaproteobacteria bacterium]|nr:hypothetical protein [Gammaproteobacteria bacterium]
MQIKGHSFYILLAVGLLISVVSSVFFVGDRVNQTVNTLQGEHRQLKAVLTANNLTQYVDNRLKLLTDLSQLPVVTSSVMGVETTLENLSDFISSYRVLGQEKKLYFWIF